MWYTAFRTYEETLRIDPSHEYLGQRLNFWVSIGVFVLALVAFVWAQRRSDEPRRPHREQVVPKGPTMTVPKGRVRRQG
jgi:prolipoprotein diacylglyceryltransferase